MGIEYKPLIKNERINRCSAILANGCQCPRAGEFHVVENGKLSQQQICARCKALQEAEFEQAPKVYTSFEVEEKKEVPALAAIPADSVKTQTENPSKPEPPKIVPQPSLVANATKNPQEQVKPPEPVAKTPASVPVTQASSAKPTQEKDVKPNVPTTAGATTNASTPSVSKPPETEPSN